MSYHNSLNFKTECALLKYNWPDLLHRKWGRLWKILYVCPVKLFSHTVLTLSWDCLSKGESTDFYIEITWPAVGIVVHVLFLSVLFIDVVHCEIRVVLAVFEWIWIVRGVCVKIRAYEFRRQVGTFFRSYAMRNSCVSAAAHPITRQLLISDVFLLLNSTQAC